MTFAQPFMLAGLAGVVAPVVIHLAARSRPRPMEWAAMRFIRAAAEQRKRRSRWEDLLLLLLRCLLIAMVAVAFAGPTFGVKAGEAETVVFVVDVTASMGAKGEAGSSLELARGAARKALDGLPAGSRVAVWGAGDVARPVIPTPTRDLDQVRAALETLKVTGCGGDLSGVVLEARRALEHEGGRRRVVVFSDGCGEALKGMEAVASAGGIPVSVEVARADITRNLSVTGLEEAGVALVGQPIRLLATIRNSGVEPERGLHVTLTTGADNAALDEATVEQLAPGATATVALVARFATAGDRAVTVRVPADGQAMDDARDAVVSVVGEAGMLIVEGNPSGRDSEREAFFLRQAMGPGFRAVTISEGEFGAVDLSPYSVVVLAGVAGVPAPAVERLHEAARRGRGVVVFPSTRSDGAGISAALSLPAKMGRMSDAPRDLTLAGGALDHPVGRAWKNADGRVFSSVGISRRAMLAPEAGRGDVVLKGSDGAAMVVAGRMWGDAPGRAVVVGVAANTAGSALPLRPGVFVPLVNAALSWAASADAGGRNVQCGRAARVGIPPEWEEKGITTEGPDGVRSPGIVEGGTVTVRETSMPGVYRVRAEGVANPLLVAARVDPGESDLSPSSENVTGGARKEEASAGTWISRSAGPGLLGGGLLVALAELWLAQFFTERRAR